MRTLPVRIASGIIAVIILFTIQHFFQTNGLVFLAGLACLIGTYEYQKMTFSSLPVKIVDRTWFIFISLIILISSFISKFSLLPLPILVCTYISIHVWLVRNRMNINEMLQIINLATLGFFYTTLLPIFVIQILLLENGQTWFLFLLSVVFAGDISAYFSGILFGHTKLMPNLSPNKTVAGALGGILGSILVGVIFGYFKFSYISSLDLAVLSAITAFFAQNGDLFKSLMKRVANVKDSGQIMPGHGGVLDRLDGVYFAGPIIFAAATTFSL